MSTYQLLLPRCWSIFTNFEKYCNLLFKFCLKLFLLDTSVLVGRHILWTCQHYIIKTIRRERSSLSFEIYSNLFTTLIIEQTWLQQVCWYKQMAIGRESCHWVSVMMKQCRNIAKLGSHTKCALSALEVICYCT